MPQEVSEQSVDLDPDFRKEIRKLASGLPAMSYYELLGVERDADAAAVRDAFFQQSRRFHPDRFFRKELGAYGPLLNEIYKRIVAAHDALRDPKLREGYDRSLGPEPSDPEPPTVARPAATPKRPVAPARRQGSSSLRERSGLRSRQKLIKGLESQMKRARSKGDRHFDQAMCEKKRENWAQAASLLKLAMAFAPRENRYRRELEEILPQANAEHVRAQRERAEQLLEQGNGPEALELLLDCSELEPTDAELAHRVARLTVQIDGDLERGLEFARRAISLDEESSEYHKTLARLLKKKGDRAGARREYQRIWEKDPLDEEAKKELQKL